MVSWIPVFHRFAISNPLKTDHTWAWARRVEKLCTVGGGPNSVRANHPSIIRTDPAQHYEREVGGRRPGSLQGGIGIVRGPCADFGCAPTVVSTGMAPTHTHTRMRGNEE